MKKIVHFVMLCLMLTSVPAVAVNYPKPTSWVNDYAGILSTSEKDALDSILQDFETQTTSQIFVAIMDHVPSGISLEEYVNELFTRWSPGQKEKDNGVLLAIFIQDRKLRIEVGYGLEATLTDAASKLIIVNEITPDFKQGAYYQGIKQGLQQIILTLHNDYKFPDSPGQPSPSPRQRPSFQIDIVGLIVIAWALLVVFNVFRMWSRRHRGWSSSRKGWKRSRRSSGTAFRIGTSILRRAASSRYHRSSGSRSRRSVSFKGFSGGGGGSSGGGGASGSW